MLDGGIHNYLEWSKKENKKSLFKGKNYVFDARMALGLDDHEIVGKCNFCEIACEEIFKCSGKKCHLIVICCDSCLKDKSIGAVYCCDGCEKETGCQCEIERRKKL